MPTLAARAQLVATGVASPWEKEYIRKDGSRVSILTAAAIVNGARGDSDRGRPGLIKRAERDLLERMRIAALTADVGMMLTHGTQSYNRRWKQRAQAIVQHLDVAFTHDPDAGSQHKVLELQASAGAPWSIWSAPGTRPCQGSSG